MLKNYLIITLRNIKKHAGYSLINISGLAVGMVCCILIFLYVRDELSFDRYHANAKQIYRVEPRVNLTGQDTFFATSPHPAGAALVGDFPEVLQSVRFWDHPVLMRNQQQSYVEELIFFTDANVFDVFSFSLLRGDPDTALMEPYSIVMTGEIARKYLSQGEPLGQTIPVRFWRDQVVDCRVTGILEDMPQNSHFRADILISYSSLNTLEEQEVLQNWAGFNTYTYILLHKGVNVAELTQKFPMFLEKYVGELGRQFFGQDARVDQFMKLELRPLTNIYLHSRQEYEIGAVGDITRLYVFAIVALLILVVACVNFINLSTARSASRAKEVGLRKVMGAGKPSLIGQFLGEAVIFSILALGIACVLVELSLPMFNAFTAKNLTFWSVNTPLLLPGLALLAVVVGIAAGTYPAFFLSGVQPVQVLKGTQRTGSRGMPLWLRKGLVILQFAISIMLIIGTLIIARQMAYLKNKHLGFQKDQILVFSHKNPALLPEADIVKAALLQHADVLGVTASAGILGGHNYSTTTFRKEGSREDEWVMAYTLVVDDQFLPTLDIRLAAGRNFSANLVRDDESGCIINETAMARFGWSSPEMAIGESLTTMREEQREDKAIIIGVVKDFHFTSLHHKVEPLILHTRDDVLNSYYIKLRTHDIPGTLATLEQTFQTFAPNYPFQYVFLDERFEALYRKEERMQQIFSYCAILAILIACLGLFGLASFMMAQRTKEIGIRKTLGASVISIVFLLSREFAQWVLFANLIAWPIAYFAMNRWLRSFAYRVSITPWVFGIAAAVTFGIAVVTVSGRTIKAALANPVDALRYE